MADKTQASIAIVQGRINYLALGTIVTEARRYVSKVVVVPDSSDNRVFSICADLGIDVIDVTETSNPVSAILSAVSSTVDSVVMLPGDGSHDPSAIPALHEYIKDGYDVVVATGNVENGYINEAVFHLNNKTPGKRRPQFIACSRQSLEKLSNGTLMKRGKMLPEQIYIGANSAGMKIKTLELDNKYLDFLQVFSIGVVVPAYNEELLIQETIKGIPEYVYRIYVIDDCSTDRTPEIMKTINDPRVVSIRHEVNKGVGAAIITGYKAALEGETDIVAVMAGDNQMDPAQLPRLLIPIMEGKADYTKGNRLLNKDFRKGMSQWRSFGNALLTLITKIGSGYWDIADPQNGYTAVSRQALEAINLDSIYTYYGYCNDILIKLNTYGMRTVDVIMPARYGNEKSKIKYGKYIMKVAPMIFQGFLWRLKTKYITLGFHPLVLFYATSMIMVPIGLIFCLWILIEKTLHQPVSANYPLLAAFITLMGVQLLLFAMLFDMQESRNINIRI